MFRSLTHFWRVNVAVVAAAAIATAVLAGAVIVGDSMRASLRELTLDRLGRIDWALVGPELFRDQLAADLEAALADADAAAPVAPVIMVRASAIHAATRALAGDVALVGVDERFAEMFAAEAEALTAGLRRGSGQLFPSLVVNRSLARELGVEPGEAVVVSYESTSEIPRESLLGNRADAAPVSGLRLTVTAVLPDRGPGRFAITAHQQTTFNAFVDLRQLQRRLDRPGSANALFVGSRGDGSRVDRDRLEQALRERIALDDLGLEIAKIDGSLRLSSRRFVLRDHTVQSAMEALANEGGRPQAVLGYLANELRIGDRSIPYSMILGIDTTSPETGPLVDASGRSLPIPADRRIVLSQWAVDELEAEVGDRIQVTYYAVGSNDDLFTTTSELQVAAVAAMTGLMIDSKVLPDFPGIAEADDMAAWEPPFPLDLGRIRAADEEFWDRYGASPKGVVNLTTAQGLWANRFGKITAVRTPAADLEEDALADALLERLQPSVFGLVFEPIKEQGLSAASGATDFAGLFIGFSIFLIASAALVVGLLFTLSVEIRAREVGLRRAVGFPPATVRRRFLLEGLTLATIGGAIGTGLAILYAAVLIDVLDSLWRPTLDLPLLLLDLKPVNIITSVVGAILLVALTIVLGLRRLRRIPTPALLAGSTAVRGPKRRRRLAEAMTAVASIGALATIGLAIVTGKGSSPAYFFVAGALLIVSGFAAFSSWCRRSRGRLAGGPSRALLSMAARNSAHNPGRSLLSVALVGCAAFMLVSVAANRRELRPEALGMDSGAGGFTLVAESDAPLRRDLRDREALADIGFDSEAVSLLETTTAFPLRLLPGEDASCLNLYQPEKPRVVGVTDDFIDRGGFRFTAATESVDNPWTLLRADLGPGVIPTIGDANSVRWILHSGLGKDIELIDDHGDRVALRIVGLLDKSIFQSELVIAEEAFLRHFPEHGGYSYFLFETSAESTTVVARTLEDTLMSYGFDVTPTVDKLARFLGIEEMYLSTFQLLGGLGLILGTVGLGVVLVRNVNERRSELAMLRAFGFERRSIAWTVVLENAFQLLVGLVIGSVAGFLALLPYLLDASLHLPWRALGMTLLTVVAVGMLSSVLGVLAALRTPLLPALKAE